MENHFSGRAGPCARCRGAIPGYRYSNAFREAAQGLIWQADGLDRWLADSLAIIRRSDMFLKLERPERGRMIRYREAYSRYDGSLG